MVRSTLSYPLFLVKMSLTLFHPPYTLNLSSKEVSKENLYDEILNFGGVPKIQAKWCKPDYYLCVTSSFRFNLILMLLIYLSIHRPIYQRTGFWWSTESKLQ